MLDYIPNIGVWIGLLVGLATLYVYTRGSLGLIGKLGVLVSGVGMIGMLGGLLYPLALEMAEQGVPEGDTGFPLTIAVVYPGALLLGIGLWRS